MNQERRWMEGHISNEQRAIRTTGHIFQTMQFTKNISKDDEWYFLRITLWRSTGELYGQFCYTSKDYGRIRGKDDQVLDNSREIQSVF